MSGSATGTIVCRSITAVTLWIVTAAAQAGISGLDYLGQQILPTGSQFLGTTVGGLSGIDYDPASGHYLALSDDRSSVQPARFYQLSLDLAAFQHTANPDHRGVAFTAVTTLRRVDGSTYPEGRLDPEGLRFDARRKQLYWSNEGRRADGDFQAPSVRAMTLDGHYLRDFTVPARYHPAGTAGGRATGDRGIRDNLSFESLALSIDGRILYTATENALAQDGDPASLTAGSNARILALAVDSGQPLAEYIYPVAPVVMPPRLPGQLAVNSLTDLLAIDERQFIAIERSFAAGAATPGTPTTGYSIRLFLVDARTATDVSALDSIAGTTAMPVTKTLLLDLAEMKNDDGSAVALANIEGITRGPIFQGRQTLILVGDNNFSSREFTQFIALAVRGSIPEASIKSSGITRSKP